MNAFLAVILITAAGLSQAEHKVSLEEFLDMVPSSDPFTEWLHKSGELPPDFAALPSHAPLPQPLSPLIEGVQVSITDTASWRAERERLLDQLHHWILGTIPPAPTNLTAEILKEQTANGTRIREVQLRFGPELKARLWVQLYIPEGAGPFPVFMTQDNHRGWAQIALRRGYIACVYAGADDRDDTDTFVEAWPEYDWSRLMRRGWAAGRCLDYLATMPEADISKSALTGHSRNGKTSLMGAAVDERIAVVISSSSGVGGSLPSRYCGENQFSEGIEHITRSFPEWFHPRWRFFAGREHKVPVDLHHLAALAAPRPCLLSIALNDTVEHTGAIQQTYLSAKSVYDLYGAADKLRILWRSGGHETWTEVIERYLDWCDLHFGRGDYEFEETFVYPWDWQGWRDKAVLPFTPEEMPEREGMHPQPEALSGIVETFLGQAPPRGSVSAMSYGVLKDPVLGRYGRTNIGAGLERDQLVFGEYIASEIYMPKGTKSKGEKVAAILYLPPFCAPTGYHAAYSRGEQAYRTLARAGYAVFCFDPIATGRRVDEAASFYERHPNWSLLGKMVRDAQAALDAMTQLPYIDPERIWVVGYESGALTAIHLAALDERPMGYGLVCPPLPYRLDADIMETGGIRRWAQERMLLPQLGVFPGDEKKIPYDLDEILAAQAPKPLVMVMPRYDRFAPPEQASKVVETLEQAYATHDASDKFLCVIPDKYNHFDDTMQSVLLDAMSTL